MKKHLSLISLAVFLIFLFPSNTFATAKPKLDPYEKVVHASKITITGTSEANASIQIVGGQGEMAPTKADSKGKFTLNLGLKENTVNTYRISAVGADGKKSETVVIEITESAEEAKKIEEEEKKDLTAPEKPIIDEFDSPVDSDTFEISGKAEGGSTIKVTGDDTTSAKVSSKGKFKVKVYLKKNKVNKFVVTAVDAAGNQSPAEFAEIEQLSAEEENNEDKDEEKPFPDVIAHWGEEYIMKLKEKNVLGGYNDGTFGPNNFITRAELTKVALLTFEFEVNPRVEKAPFKDVPVSAWFSTFVQQAKNDNIVGGFEDGSFKPNEQITRAAGLKILLEASKLDLKEADLKNNFPDVTEDLWFARYTAFGKKEGIIGGYEDNTFRGANPITRAEVAKIAIKIVELKAKILATPNI